MCIGIVSCNDETDYAKEIVGNYKGVVTIADNPVAPIANDVIIGITHVSENKVSLKMNQTIVNIPINIDCKSDVTYSDDKYNVSGNATVNLVLAEGMSAVPAPVSVSGGIDKKGAAILNINVEIPDSPLSVVFTGTKQ
jgi:hypothetical protein